MTADSTDSVKRKEHAHHWGVSCFVAAIEVRHCLLDCPATQAKNRLDEWERVDARR